MVPSIQEDSPVLCSVTDFDQWRNMARWLIEQQVAYANVVWIDDPTTSLLPVITTEDLPSARQTTFRVDRTLMDLFRSVSVHSEPARWSWMYQALWRILNGEPALMQRVTDPVVLQLQRMAKQIRRDCHKMKAFVRFKKIAEADAQNPKGVYVAWYRPDHNVLSLVADFFARRFADMDWTIWTPCQSVRWDGTSLHYFEGVPRDIAPDDELLENLWKQYYRSTFNPARIKVKMMKSEMPVRFWKTLPEASDIPELLREAPDRVAQMLETARRSARSAREYLPDTLNWQQWTQALPKCQGCDLCQNQTKTVPGSGDQQSRLILVGEQPGDQEERQGQPFVGPAGQLLRSLFQELKTPIESVYLTNSVKHFHHQPGEKARLHKKPTARHVIACQPWLAAEIAMVQPTAIVALGATAMHSLIGRAQKLEDARGQWHHGWAEIPVLVTWHPAAILRSPDSGALKRQQLKQDLQLAIQRAGELGFDSCR